MDVYLWLTFEHVGEPTDTEEAGRVDWVPLARVTDLAGRGELLGADTLVALLYYFSSRTEPVRERESNAARERNSTD